MYTSTITPSAHLSAALSAAAQTAAGSSSVDLQKARSTAQQFEGVFVGQMMDTMMSGLDADPVFGGGSAEETWRSMLNQQYGQEIAKTGKVGIADSVMRTMLQAQEQATTGKSSPMASAASATAVTAATADAQSSATQALSAALSATTQRPAEEE